MSEKKHMEFSGSAGIKICHATNQKANPKTEDALY